MGKIIYLEDYKNILIRNILIEQTKYHPDYNKLNKLNARLKKITSSETREEIQRITEQEEENEREEKNEYFWQLIKNEFTIFPSEW